MSTIDDRKEDKDGIALCASCDRCRARKTKCDGKRPCGNCASKYMKKNKMTSIDGVAHEDFDCVYSPAKRRGPIPGRTAGTSRKAGEMSSSTHNDSNPNLLQQQQNQQQQHNGMNAEWIQQNGGGGGAGLMAGQINQARVAALLQNQAGAGDAMDTSASDGGVGSNLQQQINFLQQQMNQKTNQMGGESQNTEPSARRLKMDTESNASQQNGGGVPRTIMCHTHLLDRSDPEGCRLRAYYKLSIDELFCLPPTPTDEEYCARLNIPGVTPSMIPGTHLAALSAARFAEAALGSLVHNEVSLAMELCNAVVHCLRESVQEPVQTPVMFEVSKAYFLLGVFRACRGDMPRYFKYRRVCMTYLSKLDSDSNTQTLLAAVSYLDSWAYMIYNANENALPDVDDTIPPPQQSQHQQFGNNEVESKFNIKTDVKSIACDAKNKNWIQGAPPVYLNNEAPLRARVLDALACAVRTCCDQANDRFNAIAKENGETIVPSCSLQSPTCTAVTSNENELCSRNLILSAFALMQQNETTSDGKEQAKNAGQHLVISAMDAFLENSDEAANGGFSDSQIQSLLSVCNTAVENPFLLHHAGPTYHMVTNAAVLLCHFLNGMHAMKMSDEFGPMEQTMFEEVVDTFIAIRKLLTIHRRKLPVKLRCHGIPRPNFGNVQQGQPFVDLGETLLCACRGCQGFVLMACSPCVAAERARQANSRIENAEAQEAEALEMGELDNIGDLGQEFDLDDDALLGMISNLISS